MRTPREVVGDGGKLTALYEERLGAAAEKLEALRKASGAATVDSRLLPFDRLSADLDIAGSFCSLMRSVHPDPAVRAIAEQGEQKVAAFSTDLSLDRPIYDALASVDASGADAATRHLLKKTLRDFRRAGVDKDAATRDRIKALNDELVKIGQEFDANIRNDVKKLHLEPKSLAGLPADWIAAHAPGPDGHVVVTTDYPDAIPFMTYAKDGAARKALYLASRTRAVPRNLEVLKQMLVKRHELAGLLGYPSWAAYATEDKMIGSDTKAADFIERITRASAKRMAKDYGELLARKRKDDPNSTEVFDWERAYYEDRVAAESYAFDAQAVRPYFEYGRVKGGLFTVTGRMFGVGYAKVDVPAWHPDVEVYDLLDTARGGVIGRFYLDMHPREGKYKHAAMFQIVSGVEGFQLPEAALVCNFPKAERGSGGAPPGSPTGGGTPTEGERGSGGAPPGSPTGGGTPTEGGTLRPALLEHDDVKTFFHEFGHLLHHLLAGRGRWIGTSGIRTEWDFVEAPSQMLEEWTFDYETLASFATHVETGEPIPRELVAALKASSDFGKGLQVRHQMYYAKLSLELHRRDPASVDTGALSKELMDRYSPFKFVDETRFEASFGHLDGYSAIYYTYMWSLVIAKDLFGAFKSGGLLDPKTSARYRESVLAPGGSKDANDLVKDFLGREPSFEAFERWLDEG